MALRQQLTQQITQQIETLSDAEVVEVLNFVIQLSEQPSPAALKADLDLQSELLDQLMRGGAAEDEDEGEEQGWIEL